MTRPAKIAIPDAFGQIDGLWSPRIAARVNGQDVRLARMEGAFDWHFHAECDEAFFVVRGAFEMQFRSPSGSGCDGADEWSVPMGEGDFIVVPAGQEHRPVAEQECWIMLIEPSGTLNTGNIVSENTNEARAL